MALRPRILLVALAIWSCLLVNLHAAAVARASSPQSPGLLKATQMWVDVGGYKLYIRCIGAGEPTVVFDGAGYVDPWNSVQKRIAGYRRACSYDREGMGLSDAGPAPLTTDRLVRDLHRLLINGHIPGPYLLVGNTFGGTTAYVYASRYPGEVAGVVLLDAIAGDLLSRDTIIGYYGTDIRASRAQAQKTRSLAALPLVVISHRAGYFLPQRVEGQWRRTQRALARLSSNRVYVLGEHSGYSSIPAEQPQLLIVAINQILIALRTPSHGLMPCNVFYQSSGGRCVSVTP